MKINYAQYRRSGGSRLIMSQKRTLLACGQGWEDLCGLQQLFSQRLYKMANTSKCSHIRDVEIDQWLRARTALAMDNVVPSTHVRSLTTNSK